MQETINRIKYYFEIKTDVLSYKFKHKLTTNSIKSKMYQVTSDNVFYIGIKTNSYDIKHTNETVEITFKSFPEINLKNRLCLELEIL